MITTTPRVSVLLPTFRQPEVLLLTLRDLQRQEYPSDSWELVILDDGSKDMSAQVAPAALPQDFPLTLRRMPQGGTYSHAALFNELLRLADPDSQVFIHIEDVRLKPDFIRQHIKWHVQGPPKLVTSPMCEGQEITVEINACSRWNLMSMSGIDAQAYRCCFQSVFAKAMSYSSSLREMLTNQGFRGPFDERMTGWGYHEVEFAYRAVLKGALCIYDRRCAVYHPTHQEWDEREYRATNRKRNLEEGTKINVTYLCKKHSLTELPDFVVGVPIENDMNVNEDMEK